MSERKYTTILGAETYAAIENYAAYLNTGGRSGAYLAAGLREEAHDGRSLLTALLQTKLPQIFAESAVAGDGSDWSLTELEILGGISVGMTVTIFDNGAHQNPDIHCPPVLGHLVYTAGALLRNDRGFVPADWPGVTCGEDFDSDKYYELYERRLRPVFSYISQTSIARGKPAFVTVPGIGCGQFAGPFRGQMGQLFQAALMRLLDTHGDQFPGVKAVYYDPYNECGNLETDIKGIQFFVRPLTPDNMGKSQLCRPSVLMQGSAQKFENCELYSLVAWDHVSWPGNDYYLGARVTDDGVKAAATDTMHVMTGVRGEYCYKRTAYVPPNPFRNWKHVIDQNALTLDLSGGLFIDEKPEPK